MPIKSLIHDMRSRSSRAVHDGGGAGGGGGRLLEPELLGQHAAGAAAGGAGEDRGVGGVVAVAEERGGLRRGVPELEAPGEGDREGP